MALILVFHNVTGGGRVADADGRATYDVQVSIGDGSRERSKVIHSSRIEGHLRADGWEKLVARFLLTVPAAEAVAETSIAAEVADGSDTTRGWGR